MNKLFTKVAKLVLGLSLAAGVGAAVGSQKVSRVDAATISSGTTTYTFSSASWAASGGSGNWTSGKNGGGFSNNGIQVTTTASGANATSPDTFENVSRVVLTYNTNKSAGAGTAVVKIGSNSEVSKSWAYSSGDGRSANYTLTYDFSPKQSGSVKVTLNTTTNSIYLVSCAVTCTAGASQLPSPVITKTNNVLSWSSITGAVKYMVSIDSEAAVDNGTSTSYTLSGNALNVGSHTASVVAKGNGTTYLDSDAGTKAYVIFGHAGTLADPYDVADAKLAVDANESKTGVYATGIVSEIVTAYDSSYHNVSFKFSADGSTSSLEIEAYRCKDDENDDYVSSVAIGDTVVVYGDLTLFGGNTYEFSQGCKLVSLTKLVTPSIIFSNDYGNILVGKSKTYAPATANLGGAAVSYVSSDTNKATVDSSTGEVTGVALGDTTITASATVNGNPVTDSYVLHVVEPKTVAQAKSYIDLGVNLADNYVEGIISEVVSTSLEGNNEITYNISDDGETSSQQLEVYKGKGLNGADFTAVTDLEVGDRVVVWGTLKHYNSTYEFDTGSHLISLSRPTKYSVSFNSNGGSDSPETLSVVENETFTFPSPGTKAGYVFAGWSSNSGTTKYAVGATSPAVVAAITYTAYWDVDAVETVTLAQGTFKTSYTSSDSTWDWEHLVVSYETESGASGTATGLSSSDFTFNPATPSDVSSVNVYVIYGGVKSNTLTIDISYSMGGEKSTFDAISGDLISDIVAFEARKGNAGTAPAVNSNQIRVYQNGGLFEVKAYAGYKLTSVTIGSGMSTTVTYSIDGGAASSDQSIQSGETLTVNNISASSVLFTCTGTSSSARLYVNYLAATYSVDSSVVLHTVSFDSNGGSENPANIEVAENDSFTFPSAGTKTGYNFAGWSSDGGTTKYAADETSPVVVDDITYTAYWTEKQVIAARCYTLVTDASQLSEGSKVIITSVANNGLAKALSTEQKTNNRGEADIEVDSNVALVTADDVQVITLGLSNSHWTFNVGDGYLYAASSSSNQLKTQEENDSNGEWAISISEGVASIVAQGANSRNVLQHNSESSLFACYGSASQNAVCIYKLSFEETLLHNITCDGNGSHSFASGFSWSTLEGVYNDLSSSEQGALVTATNEGMARYDYIVGKYLKGQGLSEYKDFVGRDPAQIGPSRVLLSSVMGENTNTIAIIVIVSLVSVTAIGGYFFLKKRREQN